MNSLNLRLLQLSDSALPIGGYTHSWGLEAAVARGMVCDAETLEAWTRSWLRFALGPCEAVAMASACCAARAGNPEQVRRSNAILMASLNPPSVRIASQEMGEQLLSLARAWSWSADGVRGLLGEAVPEPLPPTPSPQRRGGDRDETLPPAPSPKRRGGARQSGSPLRCGEGLGEGLRDPDWHHAVVFGVLASLAGATADDAVAAYLHQAALGMIGAALRALPIGHTHGQQVLAYLHDDIGALTADLVGRDLEQAGNGTPFYEILCDEQTRLYTRLFRS